MSLLGHLEDRLARGETLRILGLGNSLVYGWMVERGFFDRFCDFLQALHPQGRVVGRNAGIPGDTAEGGAGRLPALLADRPDLVIVEFGLNDCFMGVPPKLFEQDLRRIADTAEATGTVPLLVTSCMLASPHEAALVRPYYKVIRALGLEGIPVADLEAYQACANEGDDLWLEDGVHPSDLGHAQMARGLLERVREG